MRGWIATHVQIRIVKKQDDMISRVPLPEFCGIHPTKSLSLKFSCDDGDENSRLANTESIFS